MQVFILTIRDATDFDTQVFHAVYATDEMARAKVQSHIENAALNWDGITQYEYFIDTHHVEGTE